MTADDGGCIPCEHVDSFGPLCSKSVLKSAFFPGERATSLLAAERERVGNDVERGDVKDEAGQADAWQADGALTAGELRMATKPQDVQPAESMRRNDHMSLRLIVMIPARNPARCSCGSIQALPLYFSIHSQDER
jgi:hypothetical protein